MSSRAQITAHMEFGTFHYEAASTAYGVEVPGAIPDAASAP